MITTCHTHLTRKFSNTLFLNLFHSWHFYVSFSNFPPMHNANAAPHYAHSNEILIKKHLKMEVNMLGQLGRVWVVHILYMYLHCLLFTLMMDMHICVTNNIHFFYIDIQFMHAPIQEVNQDNSPPQPNAQHLANNATSKQVPLTHPYYVIECIPLFIQMVMLQQRMKGCK